MNHLKKFSLFENSSSINEKYFELVEILQSKVFDDFDVIAEEDTDETLDNQYGDMWRDIQPNFGKHWLFTINPHGLVSSKNIGSKVIKHLRIFNISEGEHTNFFKNLKELESLVEDYIGMKLVIKEIHYSLDEVFDYIVILEDK